MEELIGKRYIDQADSGDLVMEIMAVDSLSPNGWMIVKPVGLDRCWQRPPSVLVPLVAAYEMQQHVSDPASPSSEVAASLAEGGRS